MKRALIILLVLILLTLIIFPKPASGGEKFIPLQIETKEPEAIIENDSLVLLTITPSKVETNLLKTEFVNPNFSSSLYETDATLNIQLKTRHLDKATLNYYNTLTKQELTTLALQMGSTEAWDSSIGCHIRITQTYNWSELTSGGVYYQFCDYVTTTGESFI